MRTIPAAISDGFTNNCKPFWLVKIEASGGNTYYWVTQSTNRSLKPQGIVATASSQGGGLSDGTYYYVVTAKVGGVWQARSEQVSKAVTSLGGNQGRVILSWQAVPGATHYRVYGRTNATQTIYWEVTEPTATDSGESSPLGSPPGTDALILKATSGGGALSYDATMIADKIIEGGQERDVDGIGENETSADITLGGGISSVSDLSIYVLNHDRFDSTIRAAAINMESRPVSLYFGMMPSGPDPTVVIADDMLLRWAGVIEDVNDYNYSEFVLRCVDGTFLKHKDIPTTIVDTATFTKAPQESVGKPIPMVYGAHYVTAGEDDELDTEQVFPVPTIKTDDSAQEFYVADHECHTNSLAYVYSSENNLFGKLTTPDSITNNSGGLRFKWTYSAEVVAEFRQRLKLTPPDAWQPPVSALGLTSDYLNAFDESVTTYSTVGVGLGSVFGCLTFPRDIGTLQSVRIRTHFGAVTLQETNYIAVGYYDGSSVYDEHSVSNGDANVSREDTCVLHTFTWDDLGTYAFGVFAMNGISTMTAEVKHVCISYTVRVASFAIAGRY